VRSANGGAAHDRVDDDDPVLVALKSWRSSIAKANGVPAFVVFHDSTLHAIAHSRPDTANGLASLPGIGPVKIARYGEDLLRVVESSS
jgi:superfamily II DNA helicase RecQ